MFRNRVFLSIFIVTSTLSFNLTINPSSTPINITKANFKSEILRSNVPVILAYFSLQKNWNSSQPVYKHLSRERSLELQKKGCAILLPIFKELAQDKELQKKYKFALIDIDQETDLTLNTLEVGVIPSFEVYKNGISNGSFDSLELYTSDKEKIKMIFKQQLANLH